MHTGIVCRVSNRCVFRMAITFSKSPMSLAAGKRERVSGGAEGRVGSIVHNNFVRGAGEGGAHSSINILYVGLGGSVGPIHQ